MPELGTNVKEMLKFFFIVFYMKCRCIFALDKQLSYITKTFSIMNAIKTQVQSILVENGLDFQIVKRQLVALEEVAQTETAENSAFADLLAPEMVEHKTPYFGLFNSKSGECINSVKEGYTISQNDEVVEMVLRGIEPFSDKLNVSFGGSLNGGRKVFLQLKVEGKSKVGNDTLIQYITIIDSNDGSTSLSIGISDLCMR